MTFGVDSHAWTVPAVWNDPGPLKAVWTTAETLDQNRRKALRNL
jgi:hypothetical protein